jgi:hypothetical protein
MRTPKALRAIVAVFNLLAAAGIALYAGSADFSRRPEVIAAIPQAWGAAGAALVALAAILIDVALVAWAAIGFLLWAALLTGSPLALIFLALAVALMPVVPRPNGSVGQGLLVAAGTAAAIGLVAGYLA